MVFLSGLSPLEVELYNTSWRKVKVSWFGRQWHKDRFIFTAGERSIAKARANDARAIVGAGHIPLFPAESEIRPGVVPFRLPAAAGAKDVLRYIPDVSLLAGSDHVLAVVVTG